MFAAEGLTPVLAVVLLGAGIALLGLVGWLDQRTEGRPRRDATWPTSAEERRLMRGTAGLSVVGIDRTGPLEVPKADLERARAARADAAAPPAPKAAAPKPAAPKAQPKAAAPKAAAPKAQPKAAAKPAQPKAAPAKPAPAEPGVGVHVLGPTTDLAPTPRRRPAPTPAPTADATAAPVEPAADVEADGPRSKMPKGAAQALDALFGDVLDDRVA